MIPNLLLVCSLATAMHHGHHHRHRHRHAKDQNQEHKLYEGETAWTHDKLVDLFKKTTKIYSWSNETGYSSTVEMKAVDAGKYVPDQMPPYCANTAEGFVPCRTCAWCESQYNMYDSCGFTTAKACVPRKFDKDKIEKTCRERANKQGDKNCTEVKTVHEVISHIVDGKNVTEQCTGYYCANVSYSDCENKYPIPDCKAKLGIPKTCTHQYELTEKKHVCAAQCPIKECVKITDPVKADKCLDLKIDGLPGKKVCKVIKTDECRDEACELKVPLVNICPDCEHDGETVSCKSSLGKCKRPAVTTEEDGCVTGLECTSKCRTPQCPPVGDPWCKQIAEGSSINDCECQELTCVFNKTNCNPTTTCAKDQQPKISQGNKACQCSEADECECIEGNMEVGPRCSSGNGRCKEKGCCKDFSSCCPHTVDEFGRMKLKDKSACKCCAFNSTKWECIDYCDDKGCPDYKNVKNVQGKPNCCIGDHCGTTGDNNCVGDNCQTAAPCTGDNCDNVGSCTDENNCCPKGKCCLFAARRLDQNYKLVGDCAPECSEQERCKGEDCCTVDDNGKTQCGRGDLCCCRENGALKCEACPTGRGETPSPLFPPTTLATTEPPIEPPTCESLNDFTKNTDCCRSEEGRQMCCIGGQCCPEGKACCHNDGKLHIVGDTCCKGDRCCQSKDCCKEDNPQKCCISSCAEKCAVKINGKYEFFDHERRQPTGEPCGCFPDIKDSVCQGDFYKANQDSRDPNQCLTLEKGNCENSTGPTGSSGSTGPNPGKAGPACDRKICKKTECPTKGYYDFVNNWF